MIRPRSLHEHELSIVYVQFIVLRVGASSLHRGSSRGSSDGVKKGTLKRNSIDQRISSFCENSTAQLYERDVGKFMPSSIFMQRSPRAPKVDKIPHFFRPGSWEKDREGEVSLPRTFCEIRQWRR